MHDLQRYRYNAAECLLAAKKKHLNLIAADFASNASSWLSLARQDEAIDNLLASWDAAKLVRTDGPRA